MKNLENHPFIQIPNWDIIEGQFIHLISLLLGPHHHTFGVLFADLDFSKDDLDISRDVLGI